MCVDIGNKHSSREIARRVILSSIGDLAPFAMPEDVEKSVDQLSQVMKWAEVPILPEVGQTCVVARTNFKTAAIFFDRLWVPPQYLDVPSDIRFYAATDFEIWAILLIRLRVQEKSTLEIGKIARNSPIADVVEKFGGPSDLNGAVRMMASGIQERLGSKVIPMYDSLEAFTHDYKMGDRRTLLASIQNLPVIDEDKLSWAQISDLRNDPVAVGKIRNLRHWLDSEMPGKPISFVTDAIGQKLDDYQWSIKKHGFSTVLGSLQSIVDPKFLAAVTGLGAVVGAMAGSETAVVTTALAVMGKTAISISERFLDLENARKGDGAEVAFINDVVRMQKED
jgi:hypothetical protein